MVRSAWDVDAQYRRAGRGRIPARELTCRDEPALAGACALASSKLPRILEPCGSIRWRRTAMARHVAASWWHRAAVVIAGPAAATRAGRSASYSRDSASWPDGRDFDGKGGRACKKRAGSAVTPFDSCAATCWDPADHGNPARKAAIVASSSQARWNVFSTAAQAGLILKCGVGRVTWRAYPGDIANDWQTNKAGSGGTKGGPGLGDRGAAVLPESAQHDAPALRTRPPMEGIDLRAQPRTTVRCV